MSKPVLLGEAPSKAGDRYHAFPLSGAVGKRLCEFAGVPPQKEGSKYGRYYWALREHFDCLNAIERYDDAVPWLVAAAQKRWTRYLLARPEEEQRQPLTVVCLGRKAASAVDLRAWPWFEWLEVGLLRVAVIPHPSGRNLLYNDPDARQRAGRTLRAAIGYAVLTDPDPERRLAAERLQLGGRS